MTRPIPFDAVLFDLDGTLLATDRFWVPAARVGARRAFEELGLDREIPSAEEWMSLVGLPLAEGFDMLFAELTREQRELILERCVEEEHFALESGAAALLPGVVDVLIELKALNVPMGIASNCSQAYLDSAMQKVELREYISEGRCLDSPGISDKAEMIEDLLLTFRTRSAVMVGDRAGDRNAAHANGLPHVHLRNGFAPGGEEVICEAQIDDFLELLPRLRGRQRWIESTLADLDLSQARSLGITGRSGAGKSLYARDVVRNLNASASPAVLVSLDDFMRADRPAISGEELDSAGSALDIPGRVWRIELLVEQLLKPHAQGNDVAFELECEAGERKQIKVGANETLVLEGLYLLHPSLHVFLDKTIYLEVPDKQLLNRVAARCLPIGASSEFVRTRDRYLPAQIRFDAACPPSAGADLVLDARNPLGPEKLA
ncbi:MAG: phosphoglycolate phosphatase-like HAD superfamily hydrolase/uridine kinase [Planctomycetota bacterium]|jgi:phosphoglycolate phosphatase-like HAD superfamily hydrolase/uridine kinase